MLILNFKLQNVFSFYKPGLQIELSIENCILLRIVWKLFCVIIQKTWECFILALQTLAGQL